MACTTYFALAIDVVCTVGLCMPCTLADHVCPLVVDLFAVYVHWWLQLIFEQALASFTARGSLWQHVAIPAIDVCDLMVCGATFMHWHHLQFMHHFCRLWLTLAVALCIEICFEICTHTGV